MPLTNGYPQGLNGQQLNGQIVNGGVPPSGYIHYPGSSQISPLTPTMNVHPNGTVGPYQQQQPPYQPLGSNLMPHTNSNGAIHSAAMSTNGMQPIAPMINDQAFMREHQLRQVELQAKQKLLIAQQLANQQQQLAALHQIQAIQQQQAAPIPASMLYPVTPYPHQPNSSLSISVGVGMTPSAHSSTASSPMSAISPIVSTAAPPSFAWEHNSAAALSSSVSKSSPLSNATSSPLAAKSPQLQSTNSLSSHQAQAPPITRSPGSASNGTTPSAVQPQTPQRHPSTASSNTKPSSSSASASPPFSSSVLSTSFDADIWLLILHQLYHAPASWSREVGQTIFTALQQELRTKANQQSNATSSLAASNLLVSRNWMGQSRELSYDEVMARKSAFPANYATQLLKEMLISKQVERPLTTQPSIQLAATSPPSSPMKPRRLDGMSGVGHSLLRSSSFSTPSLSLWESGQSALLPSMRLTNKDTTTGGLNVLCALRHREIGTSLQRLVAARSSACTNSARWNELITKRIKKLKVVTGHKDPIYAISMDRTGRRVFTGSDDMTVKVWDSSSGQLLATCRGHSAVITDINVSPDNTFFTSASTDSRIRIWDLNGVPLYVLVGHTSDVMSAQFNPDFTPNNRYLVSASLDGTARVWNCSNLTEKPDVITCKPKPWPKGVRYIPYDLEGLASGDGEVDANPQQILNPEFLCLAFHPSGTEFVCGHNDHRVRVYDMKRRSVLAVLSGHRGEVERVVYSQDGTRILTIANDGEAIVWARVEYAQIVEAAGVVNYTLPTTAPTPPDTLWGANMYAGLRAAVARATPPAEPAAAAASSSSTDASPESCGLPTHRYIIVARLSPHVDKAATVASASSNQPHAPSTSSTVSVSIAVWSLHDDYVIGCTSANSVLVWQIHPSGSDGRLEMVDPFRQRRIEEEALAAALAKKNQGRVATGRSKRTTQQASDVPTLKPLTFLSCFKRTTLTPIVSFSLHTGNVGVIQRHPTFNDLFLSAGLDGRVILYSILQKRVLKVFHETYPPHGESPFIDGCFSPQNDLFVLTNELGQLYFYGLGLNPGKYLIPPEQQFFVRDYFALTRDGNDNVLDTDSQLQPHLAPSATTLCDLSGVVYSHQLPPVSPLTITPLPVPRITPNKAKVRIRFYSPVSRPKFFAESRTGVAPNEHIPSSFDVLYDPAQDCWRTSPSTEETTQNQATMPTAAQLFQLLRQQYLVDKERLIFMYQIRVAYQQQRELLRIAGYNSRERQLTPPTWHPITSLPLPQNTPLLRSVDLDLDGDDENESETRLYRRCFFDAHGVVKRPRLPSGGGAGMFAPSTTSTPAASPSRPRANMQRPRPTRIGSSNIHTLGSTRRAPIQLTNDDDNYQDDDYDPDGAAVDQRPLRVRAQGRALQRFQDLKEDDDEDDEPRAILIDDDEEEKKVETGSSREHSEYELDEQATPDRPKRSRRSRRRGSDDEDDDDEEDAMTDEQDSEEDDDSSSGGDSGDSYHGRTRFTSSRSRKRRRESNGAATHDHAMRPRKRTHRGEPGDDDWAGSLHEREEDLVKSAFLRENRRKKRDRARQAAAAAAAAPPLHVSQRTAAKNRRKYEEPSEDEFNDRFDDAPAGEAAASAIPEETVDERLYREGNWLQRPLVQQYNASYTPQLGDRVVYIRAGHEAQLQSLILRFPDLPRKLPHVRPMEHCLVVRVEYMWGDDAKDPLLARSPNRLKKLPVNHHGQLDPSLRFKEPPPVFARITLVPIEDAHLITNSRHPSLEDSSAVHPTPELGSDLASMKYDFSSLPKPEHHYDVVTNDPDRLVLRRHPTNDHQVKTEAASSASTSSSMLAMRPKRSLRSETSPPAPTESIEPSSTPAASSNTLRLPSRQSVRTAIHNSLVDIKPELTDEIGTNKIKISWSSASISSSISSNNAPAASLRSSGRQRQPKSDPYLAQLAKEKKEAQSKRDEEQKAAGGSKTSIHLPPSAFNIDLFEPQGADFIILQSRLAISRQLHPAEWQVGESFKMKYNDEPDWSEGTVCSNSMLPDASPPPVSNSRVGTRHSRPLPLTAEPSLWDSLKVTWKKEEEIQRLLDEEQAARSSSLVNTDPISQLPPEERDAARRKALLSRLVHDPAEQIEAVSPWEIDPKNRAVTQVDDFDTYLATIASKETAKQEATSTSLSAAATIHVPELIRVADPVVLVDTSESLSADLTAKLISIIDDVIACGIKFEPFASPVLHADFPEYRHVVPYAIDLSTIRRRLELRYYRTVSAVAHDAISLCRAAMLYNAPGTDIVEAARLVESKILRAIWKLVSAYSSSSTSTATASSSQLAPDQFGIFVETDQNIDWNELDEDEEVDVDEEAKVDEEVVVNATSSHVNRKSKSNSKSVKSEAQPSTTTTAHPTSQTKSSEVVPMELDDEEARDDAYHPSEAEEEEEDDDDEDAYHPSD